MSGLSLVKCSVVHPVRSVWFTTPLEELSVLCGVIFIGMLQICFMSASFVEFIAEFTSTRSVLFFLFFYFLC